ncbi:MAG: hypothetical protein EOP11_20300 [Proteobacteria bacterium]|nr:MAG: hypothetical protein EOP11_20300 [Pseudomonadota bacterium]
MSATHGALFAYARETIGACAQADQRARADKAAILRACPGSGPDACTQAMATSDTHLAEIDRGLQGIRARQEKVVQQSFPAQGAPVAGSCLSVLDTYQQFAYSVSGALNDAVKVAQADRAQIRQKMGSLLESQLLGAAAGR